jgi:hypothetical protein
MHVCWKGGFNLTPPIYHYVSREKIAGNCLEKELWYRLITGIVNNQEGIDW